MNLLAANVHLDYDPADSASPAMTNNRILLVILGGFAVSSLPAIVIFSTSDKVAVWQDWLALVWFPGAVLSRWVFRLQPHDAPFVLASIVLSGATYALAGVLLLRWWRR